MSQTILKYCLLPIFVLMSILIISFPALRFHTSELKPLTSKLLKTPSELSYNQYYELSHPLAYKLDIQNQDGRMATLLWPQEPYSTVLVIVSGPHRPELAAQTRFAGRLMICVYKCLPDDVLIPMDEFSQLIQEVFPQYLKQYSKLPQMVLDTSAMPGGLTMYFKEYKWYWAVFAGTILLMAFFFVKNVIFGEKGWVD